MTLIKKTFAVIMVLPPITPLAAQGNPQMFIWQNGKLAPLENADGVCFDQRPIWVFPDVQIVGDGLAREQAPAPGTLVSPGTKIIVRCQR